jgi:hypothetical protein
MQALAALLGDLGGADPIFIAIEVATGIGIGQDCIGLVDMAGGCQHPCRGGAESAGGWTGGAL